MICCCRAVRGRERKKDEAPRGHKTSKSKSNFNINLSIVRLLKLTLISTDVELVNKNHKTNITRIFKAKARFSIFFPFPFLPASFCFVSHRVCCLLTFYKEICWELQEIKYYNAHSKQTIIDKKRQQKMRMEISCLARSKQELKNRKDK